MLSPLNYSLQIPAKGILLFYSPQYKIEESVTLLAYHFVQEIFYLYVLYADLVLVFEFFSWISKVLAEILCCLQLLTL